MKRIIEISLKNSEKTTYIIGEGKSIADGLIDAIEQYGEKTNEVHRLSGAIDKGKVI